MACSCKINLFLEVGQKNANGLHELRSLFLPVNKPADILEIEPGKPQQLEIDCNDARLRGENNLLYRAWKIFGEITDFQPGLHLNLEKRIPVGAGLGGGSSDAAAFLGWLNSRCPEPMDSAALTRLALRIGSDVPFFLQKRAAMVSGTGEKVQPVQLNEQGLALLLAWPGIHVSTGWAFATLDDMRAHKNGNTEKNLTKRNGQTKKFSFTDASHRKEFFSIANDLEKPVFEALPLLKNLKDRLVGLGAVAAGMSGSGSAIFGIFEDFRLAQNAERELSGEYRHVHLAQWPSAGV